MNVNDQEMRAARNGALARVLESDAPRKLIVSGPGTGKTHTFRELIKSRPSPALALTFLSSLAADLDDKLNDVAQVYTLHGFARRLLHESPGVGISKDFDYYPQVEAIYEADASLILGPTKQDEIAEALMNLREGSELFRTVLEIGAYYDVVGHSDAVLRVVNTLRDDPGRVPTYGQVVVDEYQDFSALEAELVDILASTSPILVAGDDDQALYAFRHASPDFIRTLESDERYVNFELPYCSRCTQVLVDAMHRVVESARARGLLDGRIAKSFTCFIPEKREDSERFPRIVHARCSVERKHAPYMGRYVRTAIDQIPAADFDAAREDGSPTVLVVGPGHFARRIYEAVADCEYNVSLKFSEQPTVVPLDGYRRLAADPNSRLGWRILLHTHEPEGWEAWVRAALNERTELADQLSADFFEEHLAIAGLIAQIAAGEGTEYEDLDVAARATTLTPGQLLAELAPKPSSNGDVVDDGTEEAEAVADIVVTSLTGAKGLRASHVFIVGLIDGHFPRDNSAPTDEEVCQLLVALTRARKSCTIVSCRNFAGAWVRPSVFLNWLSPYTEEIEVNRDYFNEPRK